MKNLTHTIIKYAVWAVIFAGATYTYAAWNEPTCTNPSTCNADAPINVSSASQTKSGFLWSGGLGSTAGGYFSTFIGVGVSTSTNPTSLGVVGLFNGKIGATHYCNTTGTTCTAAAELPRTGDQTTIYFDDDTFHDLDSGYVNYNNTSPSSAGQASISSNIYWTLSELETIPEIASDTRTVNAIIVQYHIDLDPPAGGDSIWYRLTASVTDGNVYEAHAAYADPGFGAVTGGSMVVPDYDGDGKFEITLAADRINGSSNMFANTTALFYVNVIGYVAQNN